MIGIYHFLFSSVSKLLSLSKSFFFILYVLHVFDPDPDPDFDFDCSNSDFLYLNI